MRAIGERGLCTFAQCGKINSEAKKIQKPHPHKEAVKKPILFSTEESARVFLWIALADLVGLFFRFFQLAAVSSFLSRIQFCKL
jgi:hypothetical protein